MRKYLLTAVAAAGLMAASSQADAAIMIEAAVNTGGGYVSIGSVTDGGAGDLSPVNGSVIATFTGLGVALSLTTALGNPILPEPNFSVTSNAATTAEARPMFLRVSFTQTNATALTGLLASDFALSSLLGSGGGIRIQSFVDATNTPFGQGTPLFTNLFFTSGQANSIDPSVLTAPYSETIVMTMGFTGGIGAIAATAQLSAVPEPTTLALFGAGLLGLGLTRRRRQKVA